MILGEQLTERVHQCPYNVIIAAEVSGLNRRNAHSTGERHFSGHNSGTYLVTVYALEHIDEQVVIDAVFHIDSAGISENEVYSHFCNVIDHVIAGVIKICSGLKHENIAE